MQIFHHWGRLVRRVAIAAAVLMPMLVPASAADIPRMFVKAKPAAVS